MNYHLEVLEDGKWKRWCSYAGEARPVERRDKLLGKGFTARVVGPGSQVVSTCSWCGEDHDGPTDGSCLL